MNLRLLESNNLESIVDEAGRVIKSGGIVVLPFDTVYGFLADASNDKALKRIFKLKNRPLTKAIGLAVGSFDQINRVAVLDQFSAAFIKERVPGPFTFIVKPKADCLVSSFCLKDKTVGIRVPDSRLVLEILSRADIIGAQTSANKSGHQSAASIEDLRKQFSTEELESTDLIIDGGKIDNAAASKIIDLTLGQAQKVER